MAGRSILVVDDEAPIREMMAVALEMAATVIALPKVVAMLNSVPVGTCAMVRAFLS